MKHFFQSALLLLALLMPATAMAHDFVVDGIYYNINGNNATVTYRGSYSYSYSNEYTGDVTIPATVTYNGTTYSVTSIGAEAFRGCSGLTSINIPNSVTAIGNSAFYNCSGLTSINIPNSVTNIGYYAFSGCTGLTSIDIPNSVTAIGDEAFKDTPWYNNQPEGLVYAGLVAYKYKGEMYPGTQISLKDGTLGIADYAFYFCSGLTSIDIPNSVTTIGVRAFYECSGLTSIDIPNSVTSIGYYAFAHCSGLTSITIPNSVTAIGDGAFSCCSGLTNITIPNSVTAIGDGAFYECSELTSINIPNSVTAIGNDAFYCCSRLASIDIPNSVTSIGKSAFEGTPWYNNQPEGLVYAGLVAYKYKGEMSPGTQISLRDGTLGIAECAFSGCSGLTSINIPNSVTAIGDEAFWSCNGLTSITVASGNTKYDSRNGCNAIIETASNTLITGCQNTIIPNSVTAIGNYAFSFCSGLTSITIPNSVTAIGDGAFYKCNGLTIATLGNSVTSIGNSAFSGCSGLTSIDIPNSVTSIGESAFAECSGLTSIDIPNSVTAIGNSAFSGCILLKDVKTEISNPSQVSLGSNAFYLSNSWRYAIRTLYVPRGSLAAYQTSSWFSYFGNIMEIDTGEGAITSLRLDKESAVLIEGESLQLIATVMPENALNKTLAWASSNAAVATVDENGLVTAHSVGTATITAMTTDGSNLSASCVVTVKSLSADNAFAMPDSEVLHGEAVVIPVMMNNSEEIMAFQTDIYLPEGFTIMADENNEMMVMPSTRLTSDHMLMTERLADGAVRVLCYTPSAQAIEGNEGDLFYITVAAPGDAAGDYAIYLRNSRLTNSDYEELRLPDAGAVLTVKTFIPGDANDSHAVNVADIVTTAQYVMQRNPSPFVFEAADMNGDGEVSVTDIMLIARLILYPATEAPRHAPAIGGNNDRMSAEGITLATGETRRVIIDLDNEADYSAFQLDLTLPTGMMASNFMLTDRDGNHAMDVETLNNGKVRVLCYSPAIEAIKGNSGAVLTLDVTATGIVDGCIGVDGIELVTADCQTVRPGAFTIAVNNVTAVDEVAAGKTVTGIDYYNLAGQRVSEPASGVTLVVTTYSDGTRTTAKVIR